MKYIVTIAFILMNTILTTHYCGSIISWRVIDTTLIFVVIELLQRHAWLYYSALCSDTDIARGNKQFGSSNLAYDFSCPVNIYVLASVTAPCTAYNISENCTVGESRARICLPAN